MTLRQFEVFLGVDRAKSFRRAAEALHLSHPALSQHVRKREAELGGPLFDHLARHFSPMNSYLGIGLSYQIPGPSAATILVT